jgi:hypothetical protein
MDYRRRIYKIRGADEAKRLYGLLLGTGEYKITTILGHDLNALVRAFNEWDVLYIKIDSRGVMYWYYHTFNYQQWVVNHNYTLHNGVPKILFAQKKFILKNHEL